MDRRTVVRAAAVGLAGAVAGCSDSDSEGGTKRNDESTGTGNKPSETDSTDQNRVEAEELPPPSERPYDSIHGEAVNTHLPGRLWGRFDNIEEGIDRSIFEENTEMAQGIQREPYYIESEDLGTGTATTAEGEEYDISLISYDVTLSSSAELSSNQIESSIVEVTEITADNLGPGYLYDSEEESAYTSISELSINVQEPEREGRVTYDSSSDSQYTDITLLREAWESFLDGDEDAIEERITEDIDY